MTIEECFQYFEENAPPADCKCYRKIRLNELRHTRRFVVRMCVTCGGGGFRYEYSRLKSPSIKSGMRRRALKNIEFIKETALDPRGGCDVKGCHELKGLWSYEKNEYTPHSIFAVPAIFNKGRLLCETHRNEAFEVRKKAGRPAKAKDVAAEERAYYEEVAMNNAYLFVTDERKSIEDLIERKKKALPIAPQVQRVYASESAGSLAPYEGGKYPDIPFTYTHRPCENNDCKKVHPLQHYNVYRKRDNQFMFVSKYCEECRMKARKERSDKQNAKVRTPEYLESMTRWAVTQMRSVECIVCKSVEVEDKAYYNIHTKRRIPFHLKPFLNPDAIVAHTECMPAFRKKMKAMNAIALEEKAISSSLTNDLQ